MPPLDFVLYYNYAYIIKNAFYRIYCIYYTNSERLQHYDSDMLDF